MPTEPDFDKQTDDLEHDRPLFDHFAWQAFVALNWPADPDKRGVAHPTKEFGATERVVWGSWKSLDELFPERPDIHPPTQWDSFEYHLAVPWTDQDGTKKLHTLRLRDANQKDNSPQDTGKTKVLLPTRLGVVHTSTAFPKRLGPPLIAQNRTYVWYETRVNQVAYDFIREGKYYFNDHLPPRGKPIPFPTGSIHIKAAWMELPDGDANLRERFYTTSAQLIEPTQPGTPPIPRPAIVGLVGLHIVCKTANRPAWIWATFEHVDNTELGPGAERASFTGDPNTRHEDGYSYQPDVLRPGEPFPSLKQRAPVSVTRLTPFVEATEQVNNDYRRHPQIEKSVWRYYRLVKTQWPKKKADGRPDDRLPGDVKPQPATPVANTTIETYFQQESCMGCHGFHQIQHFQFVLYPEVRAYKPKQP